MCLSFVDPPLSRLIYRCIILAKQLIVHPSLHPSIDLQYMFLIYNLCVLFHVFRSGVIHLVYHISYLDREQSAPMYGLPTAHCLTCIFVCAFSHTPLSIYERSPYALHKADASVYILCI